MNARVGTVISRVLTGRFALPAVLAVAFALRLGIGVYLGFDAPPDRAACGADTVEFEHMAWSLSQGKGLTLYDGGAPTSFRAPGYPLLLGGLYTLFGRAYWVNRLVLSLIGAATCGLVHLLALRLGMSRAQAIIAALIAAVLPLQFYFCGHFMAEPPAAFLNVACCLAMAAALDGKTRKDSAQGGGAGAGADAPRLMLLLGAGMLCGLSVLVRPASILVPFVFPCLLLCSRRIGPGKAALAGALFLAGTLLPLAPWVARNWVVFDRFCLVATNGGSTFWGANNRIVSDPGNREWGYWISTNFDPEVKKREVLSLANEVDRDRKELALGLDFLRRNPGRIPVLLAGKMYRLITPFPLSANKVFVLAVAAGQLFLLPACIAGAVLLARRRAAGIGFIPVWSQLVVMFATALIFYGSERFRAPYEQFLALFAAMAVAGRDRQKTVKSREKS